MAAVLCLLLVLTAAIPVVALAQDDRKIVRVGWYESSFNTLSASGRRSGYAYEYQLKVAAYTGWKYSYVTGSWSDLMQMLIEGQIDLMSDVSYTEERAENMLFPDLSMGTEEYYLFISPDNREITSKDYSSLNGKRIGVNQGSVQKDFFLRWEEQHDVHATLVELRCEEDESLEMLAAGTLDAYITVNAFGAPEQLTPVCKIGASDIFFAVSKNRPDLLHELNSAMSCIQDENPYYNQRMFEKHVQRFGANAFLTDEEESWLTAHGAIRVGYQDNYLAFCAVDPETGELTGALKDYLQYASDSIKSAGLTFRTSAFPTAAAALDALQRGEIDCMFPANISGNDVETMNILLTPPLMSADIYAVVPQADISIFARQEHVIVAVNEGNPNYDAFLRDHFPKWRKVYYSNTQDCLRAVSDGVADCILVCSYRYNNISRLCNRYRLTSYAVGSSIEYAFAVSQGETTLYSILAKAVGLVPESTVHTALSYYITEDAKLTLGDFLLDNLLPVMCVIAAVVLVILILMVRSMRAEQKAKQLISATETDDLTGLYNRDFFFQYADRMYREHPETPRDAIVLNIEQFHSIVALNGWELGNRVLRVLGSEIRTIANDTEGIAGRFGADRFDIYCRHMLDYSTVFKRLQSKLDALTPNTSIRLRMGVMPAQEKLDPVQQFDRARTACSMARGHYKEHLIVFDEKVRERELRDQRLLNDLRRALDSFELEVYYQPKYNIQTDPPQLVSAEALVRWQHPELGMLAPDDFIPLLERNGKIVEVDKYVWDQAARQIAGWKAQFGVKIPVSVNLSRVDLLDPTLESTLDGIIAQNGLERDMLMLEVTESAYTEHEDQVIRVLESLRKKGYTVEMDDFGTGYSSLHLLLSMPIDVLKIDRIFVQNLEQDERGAQLVTLILNIAKELNVPAIAEGVETEGQLRRLKEMGCTIVQGYYFSCPLHPTEFEAKLILRQISEKTDPDNIF